MTFASAGGAYVVVTANLISFSVLPLTWMMSG
jgi:hypothetical protein